METGLQYISTLVVDAAKTAQSMGSGDLPVLATPAMIALMENAAMLAVTDALPAGTTTVGGRIAVSHLRPTPIGQTITATATLTQVEGNKLSFHLVAYQGDVLVGEGEHLRFIVTRERFLAKV